MNSVNTKENDHLEIFFNITTSHTLALNLFLSISYEFGHNNSHGRIYFATEIAGGRFFFDRGR